MENHFLTCFLVLRQLDDLLVIFSPGSLQPWSETHYSSFGISRKSINHIVVVKLLKEGVKKKKMKKVRIEKRQMERERKKLQNIASLRNNLEEEIKLRMTNCSVKNPIKPGHL